jgi:enoyl-CoA hydratase/carnithine racemase
VVDDAVPGDLARSSGRVRVAVEDAVCTVELRDPDGYNPMTRPVLGDLRAALAALDDLGARAFVLVSSGKYFSTGGDHRADHEVGREGLRAFLADLTDFYRLMVSAPVPVVVGVHASSFGAGTDAVVLADHSVIADDATIQFGHLRNGMAPVPAIVATVVARVGLPRARGLLIFDEQVTAVAAAEMGLVDECVPARQVLDVAATRARELAALPPVAMARTRVAFDLALGARAESLQAQLSKLQPTERTS